MASLNTQGFTALLSALATSIQGAATVLIDFSVGAVLRAVGEAHIGIALWLQGLLLEVAALTRFATSDGADADSWGADFNFPRLPAQPSEGPVTLSRNTATAQATVQAGTASTDADGNVTYSGGATVQTQDGTQQYQIIPDATQSAYNATLNQYVIAANTSSITVTVQAITAGSASNVAAGAINTLGSAIPGVDTVTNAAGFTNGADAESDPAYKARFVLYLASLPEGTPGAVGSAVEGVQQDISYDIVENQTFAGVPQQGYFYVVVDDGTGNPSSQFLSAVFNAVDAVRPIGSSFDVFGPTLQFASVTLSITSAAGYDHPTLVGLVTAALTAYINALPIGASLPWSRLAQVAYDASAGVSNVSGVSLNGGTSDLTSSAVQIIKAGSITVT